MVQTMKFLIVEPEIKRVINKIMKTNKTKLKIMRTFIIMRGHRMQFEVFELLRDTRASQMTPAHTKWL